MRRWLTEEKLSKVSRSLLRAANVPLRFWDAKFKLIKDQEVREVFEPMLASVHEMVNEGRGLLLCGPLSGGKTALSVVFAKEVIRRGGVVTFIPVDKFMDIVINNVRMKGEDETLMQRIDRSHLVILDDLGTEAFKKMGAGTAMLESLVRQLYNNKASLIVTSNKSVEEIKEDYTPSLFSLIQRMLSDYGVENNQWGKKHGH